MEEKPDKYNETQLESAEKKKLETWKENNMKYLLFIIDQFETEENAKEYILIQRKETETYVMQSKDSIEGLKYHTFVVVKHPALKLPEEKQNDHKKNYLSYSKKK